MRMNRFIWSKCDSKNDMDSRLSKMEGTVLDVLSTEDANSWGYFSIDNLKHIPIGYSNAGFMPKMRIKSDTVFIGISEILVGYQLYSGELIFKYKMPTLFHAFVCFKQNWFIVLDEIGFVSLSCDGTEKWVQLYEDVIESYKLKDNSISGKTLEGKIFNFTF